MVGYPPHQREFEKNITIPWNDAYSHTRCSPFHVINHQYPCSVKFVNSFLVVLLPDPVFSILTTQGPMGKKTTMLETLVLTMAKSAAKMNQELQNCNLCQSFYQAKLIHCDMAKTWCKCGWANEVIECSFLNNSITLTMSAEGEFKGVNSKFVKQSTNPIPWGGKTNLQLSLFQPFHFKLPQSCM